MVCRDKSSAPTAGLRSTSLYATWRHTDPGNEPCAAPWRFSMRNAQHSQLLCCWCWQGARTEPLSSTWCDWGSVPDARGESFFTFRLWLPANVLSKCCFCCADYPSRPFRRSCRWPGTGYWGSRPQTWRPATTRRHCKSTADGRPKNTAKLCTAEIT